ncbi:MAG: ABC transporter permease [Protaetiibacter sp.]
MIRVVIVRVIAMLPVMLGVAVAAFFMIRLVPGDIVDALAAEELGNEVAEEALRAAFGLDQPIHVQFASWFGHLLTGDLGTSFRSGKPVLTEIIERFPLTLELTVAAIVVSLLIAIPLGILSATRRNGPLDVGARFVSLLGVSVPNFWLGILLIALFAVVLRWLPSSGSNDFEFSWDHFRFLILPALTLGTSLAAVTMRMTRSALLEVLKQDYVRTARAKGLREWIVVTRHALRNSLIPVITIVGIQAGSLLGGTVVVEQVFSWGGLGSLVVQSIYQRDYPLLQGLVVFLAFFYLAVNLIVDIVYMYVDPRLRRHG